ncbi:MAG: hypothetical protein DMF90_12595 [Acidobacteria bacterium]|nr:MAG: hypothetical protein DMF90_12595 [Acidobacteriota bacterium]
MTRTLPGACVALSMRGTALVVGVLVANGHARIGRFGWKSQHASLESFAVDAYLNEMGITTPLLPDENTSSGRDVSAFDPVPDPEDDGQDALAFANFMRATKKTRPVVPSRPRYWRGNRSSSGRAARPAISRRSRPRPRARSSTAAN